MDETCSASGICTCKNNLIGGNKCDKCVDSFFGFPNCQGLFLKRTKMLLKCFNQIFYLECQCNLQGTEKGDPTCTNDAGKCNCKCDVSGDKCDTCELGHQGFPDCHGKL